MAESAQQFLKPGALERTFNRVFGFLVGHGFGLRHNYVFQVQEEREDLLYSSQRPGSQGATVLSCAEGRDPMGAKCSRSGRGNS